MLRPVISPSSVGATLSITREKFGQELKQVAQTLRIKLSYLEAIEDDRYSDLPGLTYAVGFVRSYADNLGLDSKDLVERYKDEAQGLNRKTQLVFPTPAAEAKVPTGAIILVALILVGLTYIGWTYFSDDAQTSVADAGTAPTPMVLAPPPEETPATTSAPIPGPTAMPAPAAAPAPQPVPASAAENGTAVAQDLVSAPQPDVTAAAASEAPAAAEAAPAVPAAPPAPAAEGAAAGGTAAEGAAAAGTQTAMAPPLPAAMEQARLPRLVIQATQDSWVQIRNKKDEAILTQVLREGDSYEVPEEKGLVLLTGNAGGITLVVDGKPLAPLGPVGSVRRNIALDPDALGGSAVE
jgi:cytoskeleton protein RodZ